MEMNRFFYLSPFFIWVFTFIETCGIYVFYSCILKKRFFSSHIVIEKREIGYIFVSYVSYKEETNFYEKKRKENKTG